MVETRRTRKLRIRRKPTVQTYTVPRQLATTGPRQEHRTPKQKKAARESARQHNTVSRARTNRTQTQKKTQSILVSKLYAKTIHQANTLKEMLKVVEMSQNTKPVRNAVTKIIREQFSD
jgi:hypothetical protein